MKPYYEDRLVKLYLGDARELISQVGQLEVIVTDPVWPNCEHVFPGIDAFALLGDVLSIATVERVCIQLGFNSDPRYLQCVPNRYKFLRVCYLEYAVVGYLGRLLRDAEVGYIFGDPPASRDGARVLPGRVIATRSNADKGWSNTGRVQLEVNEAVERMAHPTRRLIQHVRWLVKWFSEESVLDPFAGSGTTLCAAKELGRRAVGIEINEKYCEFAAKRLEATQEQTRLDLSELVEEVPTSTPGP
jgi:hypothetical protein